MAAATVNALLDEVEDFQLPPRKKPKVSELPLSSAQRASIDGMLHTFKKKGDFDALRKKALQQYNESAQRGMFEAALRKFTADEIDREPVKYLKPDRRLAAPLLEGAAARANVYDQSQADVDSYIEQYLATAEVTLREIRRKEIGEEAAADEVKRGSKSEEEYKAEAEVRRKDREKKHVEQEKLRLKKEMQERKKQELQALKKKQEELMKETERLQREQKRRQEREEWKKAEKEREKERIAKFNEERERQKKEAEEREKAAQVEREKRQKEREQRDKERLEQEALERLLNEGRAMTDRGRRPELERSESMEPPPRMRHHAPNTTLSKDEMRARGLMPTSLTLRKGDKPDNIPNGPRAPAAMPYEDDIRKRNSRLRSPSPTRSVHSRSHRESAPSYDDRRPARRDNSRDYYRDSSRREAYYRDVEDDREAWRSRRRDDRPDRDRARDRDRDREREREKDKGEEGEVVERASVRPRSRSRDSYRRRESPRRSYRERSRSRSPPRHMARRRSRSRSPAGIDRYVPGGGGAAAGRDRDRDRDRDSRRDRSRDRDRYRDRGDSDRYIPRSERDDADRPRRRERSRSRERRRERSRESYRDRDRERDR